MMLDVDLPGHEPGPEALERGWLATYCDKRDQVLILALRISTKQAKTEQDAKKQHDEERVRLIKQNSHVAVLIKE